MKTLFGKSPQSSGLDLEMIGDPAIYVSKDGSVLSCNSQFTEILGWKRSDVVGQNVHVFISSRIIKRSEHDEKMKNYVSGQKSTIVGVECVLPVGFFLSLQRLLTHFIQFKNPQDVERLFRVQIVPIQEGRSVNFLAFIKELSFDHIVLNPQFLLQDILSQLEKLPTDFDFSTFLPDEAESSVLRLIKQYIQGDLFIMSLFLVEHNHDSRFSKYLQLLLQEPTSPFLKQLYELVARTRKNPELTFINIVVLRLLLPPILHRIPSKSLDLKNWTKKLFGDLNLKSAISDEIISRFELSNSINTKSGSSSNETIQ